MASVVREGMTFLMTGQVKTGEYAGGFLFKVPALKQEGTRIPDRDTSIRIDYVQHALSAMLRYQKFLHEEGVLKCTDT
jgi:hypothetical protein